MKRTSKRRILYEITALLLTVCLLWTGLFFLGSALLPERVTYGCVWSSYLQEPEDSIDVLFLGTSRVYCDVIPAELYAQTGVTSYVMAGISQPLPVTYYYLREALKTQSPKCVFLELSSAFYPRYVKSSDVNVVYMPAGLNRLQAALQCEKEVLWTAVFPLRNSHERIFEKWTEEPPEEDGTMLCGYTPLYRINPLNEAQREECFTERDELYLYNLGYLKKIAACCQERGIALYCYFAPSGKAYWDQEKAMLFEDLAELPLAAVEDWSGGREDMGLNSLRDWNDKVHLNYYGARAFTDFLADYLRSRGIGPTENADEALWSRRVAYLDGLKEKMP